jgi:tripartite-type tricarboxylate transporter receptor subunit TctC
MRKYRSLILFAVFASLAGVSVSSAAQSWPQRPIRIIVPFAAGGPADMFARLVAPKMSAKLGQPVVVENRGGAGGALGIDMVAKANPDGYTIGLSGTGAITIAPHLTKLPYSPSQDLAYISMVARVPNVVTVNGALGITSMAGLISAARQKPGKLNFGSAGSGSTLHLAGELLKQETKIDIVHIPYKGAAPAVTDLIAGQVQILIANANGVISHIKSGAITALAVTSPTRLAILPNVPSVVEAGLPGLVAEDVYGLLAPAKISQDVQRALSLAAVDAVRAPDVVEKFAEQGAVATSSTPEEYRQWMVTMSAKWANVIKQGNITAD